MGIKFLVELPDNYSGINVKDIKRYITSGHFLRIFEEEITCTNQIDGKIVHVELFESEETKDKALHTKIDRIEAMLIELASRKNSMSIGGVR